MGRKWQMEKEAGTRERSCGLLGGSVMQQVPEEAPSRERIGRVCCSPGTPS